MQRLTIPALAAAAAALIATVPADATSVHSAGRRQSTQQISRAYDGGQPNGPASNAVISNDKRFARLVAYQSAASNIVRGDVNGVSDVFAVRRRGPVRNNGG